MSVIKEELYRNHMKLTEFIVPDDVEAIEEEAFRNCVKLETVTLPDGLASIGEEAFRDCVSLREIRVPDSVEVIQEEAFRDCKVLREVKLGYMLEEIGEEAFRGCRNLREIIIPDRVEEIGDEAFRGCVSMIAAEIPENVEVIGDYAFMDCPKLTIYTVGGSVAAVYAQKLGIPVKPVSGSEQLEGKNIVLSGLRGHQREQVMEVLEAAGGIFKEEVCGNTHYLIYDPEDGTDTKKYEEALEYQEKATGILLMDYRELVE